MHERKFKVYKMSGNQNERDNNRDLNLSHTYDGVLTDEYNNERNEKPWQRVSSPYIIVLLGVYLLLGYLTQLVENDMPRVINDVDIPIDRADIFSEEIAWRYLYQIMGDQARVAGTTYHLKKTKDIKAFVDAIALSANQNVKTDWQLVTGDFSLPSSRPSLSYYHNVSNVIAVLEGESGFHSNGSISTSILINCHYDSVPYALGTSDNVVFCATMAETLSRLSKRTNKFKHNIVFLFNGAEENSIQASHGFLQHPWSRGITSVVNLDAVGMNGKAAIFQVTDPRVLDAYKRVVSRPNAQSFGQFLFDTRIIPSDTDFRIWREFGHFQGIDVAFTKWASVYHTRYDHPALLKPGVLQWSGDMLMSLITELADMEQLNEIVKPETAVYYDYLNLFLISYSSEASYAVDLLIALFGFISIAYYIWLVGPRMSTVEGLVYAIVGRVVCGGAGAAASALCVLVMVATTVQLRYLSQPWIVVPLYWMPYLITAVATSHLYDSWRTSKSGLNRSLRTLQAMAATRAVLCVILVLMVCVPTLITTRYVISVPLFIMSAISLISLTLVRYFRLQAWQHLIVEVILSVPSTMFMYTLVIRLNAIMLPTMGRTPTSTPDYIVAMINVGLAIVVSSTISGIELLFSKKRLWMVLSALGAVCVVFMFIPFSPYSDNGPSTQRHYWFHTEITTYDISGAQVAHTSGVFVSEVDAYSTESVLAATRAAGFNLNTREQFHEDCQRYVYCNLPVYRLALTNNLDKGLFLYTDPPTTFRTPASTRLSSRECRGEICTYSFVMTGGTHTIVTIWPRENVTVNSWSFSSPATPAFRQAGRPVYVIYHSIATYSETFDPFTFNVTTLVPLHLQSEPVLELSHHSNKIYQPEELTGEYRRLVEAMPHYFNIASTISFRNNYVF